MNNDDENLLKQIITGIDELKITTNQIISDVWKKLNMTMNLKQST